MAVLLHGPGQHGEVDLPVLTNGHYPNLLSELIEGDIADGEDRLARRFRDDVRARVPEVEPLPEPIPSGPPTLF